MFGRFRDLSRRQPNVDDLAILVDRTPQIPPLAAHRDVGFVDASSGRASCEGVRQRNSS